MIDSRSFHWGTVDNVQELRSAIKGFALGKKKKGRRRIVGVK